MKFAILSSGVLDSNSGSPQLKLVLSTVHFWSSLFLSDDTIHTGINIVYYNDLNHFMEETAAPSIPFSTSLQFQTFLRAANYWFSSIMCLLVSSKKNY